MSSNARQGLRPLADVMLDWLSGMEDEWKKKGEPLPEPMKKGFAEMRGKIHKPKRAA